MLSLSSSLFRLGVGDADNVILSQLLFRFKLVGTLVRLANALAAGGTALTQVQAVQLASSLAVVWQSGRSILERFLHLARATGMVGIELDNEKIMISFASCQSSVVYNMLEFLHYHAPPGAAASFARGFMKPGTVLPWLEAVAEAFELVPESARESGELATCLGCLWPPCLLCNCCCRNAWQGAFCEAAAAGLLC
jgi:hypothetical protein